MVAAGENGATTRIDHLRDGAYHLLGHGARQVRYRIVKDEARAQAGAYGVVAQTGLILKRGSDLRRDHARSGAG